MDAGELKNERNVVEPRNNIGTKTKETFELLQEAMCSLESIELYLRNDTEREKLKIENPTCLAENAEDNLLLARDILDRIQYLQKII